jgi:class 3 adenylate cyclase/tetratricopeptide (TPR) repeat protein
VICASCGTENEAGRRFCRECGTQLALACPACGTPNASGDKFCGACGTRLGGESLPALAPPAAERRLVSVLFADLVGFTAASEDRDAEETRELLSRYFDSCRTLIERYGGTVEKFIGDAVMAVWGTPVAQEDDAERAVRAALDLVAAVPDLDGALQARAGVLTGEAAVTLGATAEGMVAGDLVNTASRVQAAADPGTVLVGESTRRASEAAIAYADAGEHELKGKAEPVPLSRALRVTAARGGALRSPGLEPPFVGRDRQLALVKELFHTSTDERTAHLVSVVGVAGSGKSRFAWEFYKYIDGVAEQIRWHRGRCLAYGEGVTYWALAEMVRMRAEIVEGEEAATARPKLREAVATFVSDSDEQEWVEPRLAQLLGLEEGHSHAREDLFAGWRLFFERMSEVEPTVLVFDDMQWADAALLEFVEYLLEWSRGHPIFIVTFARPDLLERHPDWGAGKRSFTSLFLEPLPEPAMEELLDGLVPGLPDDLTERILARAEGVPLYAVETVRMLLDRGLLERAGDVYRPTGAIEALDVPETLHALVAARLDGLEPDKRRLVQDASVLGKTFTSQAIAAVSGRTAAELEALLTSLVRKEILSVQADPRSPERGQYGFLQDLLRHVAYDTLARRDRKARHLAAAGHLARAFGGVEQEVVEVIAAHYLAAFEAAPDDPDAAEIKANARETLSRAGERAASLAATEEAQRYFEQAAGLADEQAQQAALLERAGQAAYASGRFDVAQEHFDRAIRLFEAVGETHPAARVSSRLARVLHDRGRIDEAVERMEQALAVLAADEPDSDLAALAHELARLRYFRGELDLANERIELALDVAESLRLPETTSQALNTKALIIERRPQESLALMREALRIALEHDLTGAALRAYNNMGVLLQVQDLLDEYMRSIEEGLALAQRRGDRSWEWTFRTARVEYLYLAGLWEEALAAARDLPDEARSAGYSYFPAEWLVQLHSERGELDEAAAIMSSLAAQEESADLQARGVARLAAAVFARASGSHSEALAAAEDAYACLRGLVDQYVPMAVTALGEAALALRKLERVDELLHEIAALKPAQRSQSLVAHEVWLVARLAVVRGDGNAEPHFRGAIARFRELGLRFWVAVTLLEHGEWLAAEGKPHEAEPLLGEARQIFERLGALPYLERCDRARTRQLEPA